MGKAYKPNLILHALYNINAAFNSEEYFGPDRTGKMYQNFFYLKYHIRDSI